MLVNFVLNFFLIHARPPPPGPSIALYGHGIRTNIMQASAADKRTDKQMWLLIEGKIIVDSIQGISPGRFAGINIKVN